MSRNVRGRTLEFFLCASKRGRIIGEPKLGYRVNLRGECLENVQGKNIGHWKMIGKPKLGYRVNLT